MMHGSTFVKGLLTHWKFTDSLWLSSHLQYIPDNWDGKQVAQLFCFHVGMRVRTFQHRHEVLALRRLWIRTLLLHHGFNLGWAVHAKGICDIFFFGKYTWFGRTTVSKLHLGNKGKHILKFYNQVKENIDNLILWNLKGLWANLEQ